MAYKDKDKQREANAERQRRYKAKAKALPKQGVTPEKALLSEGVTGEALPEEQDSLKQPSPLKQVDSFASDGVVMEAERTAQGNIRVSKPGDTDYVPQCETTRAFIEGRDKRLDVGKRGKDIKCFEDLPPAAQLAIDTISENETEHKRRTAIAINYQHQFPDRYHSTGVV